MDFFFLDNTNPIACSSTQPIDKYFTSDPAIEKKILTFSSLYNLNFNVEKR
jgi:hypothetical protein